ncbi:hypothetical protein [Virgibacillus kimchii]
MKKTLFIILIVGFLAACGSNELEVFSEEFNRVADTEDLAKIDPDYFGEIQEEDDGFSWRELYESDRYVIEADYEGNNITGYRIMIDSSEPFEEQEGHGYRASISMADALGLSSRDFSSNFSTALRTDEHSYSEGDFEVSFTHIGWDSSIDTSIFVRFEKK